MHSLVTDPHDLYRSDLPEDLAVALRKVEALRHLSEEPVKVDDEFTFVPDGQDAKKGTGLMIIGGVVGGFGLALVGVVLEGAQAEPWMRWVAPVLALAGGLAFWTARKDNVAAQREPRTTGSYLLPDVLLHVSDVGCRTFPRELIRGFDYRARADRGSRSLYVRYADGTNEAESSLGARDARVPLEAWLNKSKPSTTG